MRLFFLLNLFVQFVGGGFNQSIEIDQIASVSVFDESVVDDIVESEQIEEIGAVVDVDVFHCCCFLSLIKLFIFIK